MVCKKKVTKRKKSSGIKGRAEDTSQRRKYKKGGRIEAYTFGEAQRSKNWP